MDDNDAAMPRGGKSKSLFDKTEKIDETIDDSSTENTSKITRKVSSYISRTTSLYENDNDGEAGAAGFRQARDEHVVTMKNAMDHLQNDKSVEEDEQQVRNLVSQNNSFFLSLAGNYASLKVFLFYLITIDTIVACMAVVGLTLFWYYYKHNEENWSAGRLSWSLIGFAVVLPISSSINKAFARREKALDQIARFRSFATQIYFAHLCWDWNKGKGRRESKVDWIEHSDKVLDQLVGIADELARFLSLPTSSGTRHRILHAGHVEAKKILEVSYRLFDSLANRRMLKLSVLTEDIKTAGLSGSEGSRLRQYERYLGDTLEKLRHIKMYRTPQALRAFARIFTMVLPAFYAPSFAELALEIDSLAVGIIMGLIATLALASLFESIQILEDPFVAFVTLDGIGIREELEVLHWQQLVNAREMIFPDAPPFPQHESIALTPKNSFLDKKLEEDAGGRRGLLKRQQGLYSTGRGWLNNSKEIKDRSPLFGTSSLPGLGSHHL